MSCLPIAASLVNMPVILKMINLVYFSCLQGINNNYCGILHLSQVVRGSFSSDGRTAGLAYMGAHQRKCKFKWPADGSSLNLPGIIVLSSVKEGPRRESCVAQSSQTEHLVVGRVKQDSALVPSHCKDTEVGGVSTSGSQALLSTPCPPSFTCLGRSPP